VDHVTKKARALAAYQIEQAEASLENEEEMAPHVRIYLRRVIRHSRKFLEESEPR